MTQKYYFLWLFSDGEFSEDIYFDIGASQVFNEQADRGSSIWIQAGGSLICTTQNPLTTMVGFCEVLWACQWIVALDCRVDFTGEEFKVYSASGDQVASIMSGYDSKRKQWMNLNIPGLWLDKS